MVRPGSQLLSSWRCVLCATIIQDLVLEQRFAAAAKSSPPINAQFNRSWPEARYLAYFFRATQAPPSLILHLFNHNLPHFHPSAISFTSLTVFFGSKSCRDSVSSIIFLFEITISVTPATNIQIADLVLEFAPCGALHFSPCLDILVVMAIMLWIHY